MNRLIHRKVFLQRKCVFDCASCKQLFRSYLSANRIEGLGFACKVERVVFDPEGVVEVDLWAD